MEFLLQLFPVLSCCLPYTFLISLLFNFGSAELDSLLGLFRLYPIRASFDPIFRFTIPNSLFILSASPPPPKSPRFWELVPVQEELPSLRLLPLLMRLILETFLLIAKFPLCLEYQTEILFKLVFYLLSFSISKEFNTFLLILSEENYVPQFVLILLLILSYISFLNEAYLFCESSLLIVNLAFLTASKAL